MCFLTNRCGLYCWPVSGANRKRWTVRRHHGLYTHTEERDRQRALLLAHASEEDT